MRIGYMNTSVKLKCDEQRTFHEQFRNVGSVWSVV
jgi:hypothetical protein